ncbi:MAG: hypothetical protein AB1689_04975, partial [Thermodesulfobacteriota bacterium]
RERGAVLRACVALALTAACVVAAAPHAAPTMAARLGSAAPDVYRWLAAQPGDGAVLELPAAATDHDVVGNLRNARYMVASTLHWRPLLNGVTGHNPPIARFYNALARRLPREEAVELLRRAVDVDWVVLHRDALLDHERAAWQQVDVAGLESVARFGDDEVFAVRRDGEPPWGERLVEQMKAADGRTLDGLPTSPLPPGCRAARILDVETPPVLAMAPLALPIPVRFVNDSPCPWPTIAVRPDGLVGLTYAWTDPAGAPYTYPPAPFSPLIRTVAPGETVDDTLVLVPPSGPEGRWRLDVYLTQWGERPPMAERTVFVEARAFRRAPRGGDPLPRLR